MHPHAVLIQSFYDAFARRDAEAMVACYHPQVHFSDPVFPDLQGQAAGDMWRMLCGRAQDLVIRSSNIQADDQTGSAHWDADYTFSATGRMVHNRIDAAFRFQDGKIIDHKDTFDLYAWTRMALGVSGILLGWTPMVQNKVRGQAAAGLAAFQKKRAG